MTYPFDAARRALAREHADWLDAPLPYLAIGDGWVEIVERFLNRVATLLRRSNEAAFRIVDVKEKYGTIRVEWFAAVDLDESSAIERFELLAELRSECTCDECGAFGKLRSTSKTGGWLATRCDAHAQGFSHTISNGPPRHRIDGVNDAVELVYHYGADELIAS